MKVTIRKIAELAGVSRGTVDRVLNDRPGVSPEVKERITNIMSELGYTPNKAAKALAFSKKPALIGIIMPPKEITFFESVRSGIEAASEEFMDFSIKIEYRHVSNLKSDEAIKAIDELIASGTAGLMISALDDIQIRRRIDMAVDNGIPVVTFNSDITSCKRMCFVGQDLYKSGAVAAGLMSKLLNKNSKVIALTGNLKFHAHRTRIEGFTDRLKELGLGPENIYVIEGFESSNDTFDKILAALKNDNGIKGIYLATGPIEACIEAVKGMGRENDIHIISNDLLPEVQENMEKGIIDFTIVQNPFLQGYLPVKLLYENIFMGKRPESGFVSTGIEIKILENIQ